MAILSNEEVKVVYENRRTKSDNVFVSELELERDITVLKNVPNAYHMISNISGNKDSMIVDVSVYKDASKTILLNHKQYTFTPDVLNETTPNFYVQAYTYMKTLPEYVDALDV